MPAPRIPNLLAIGKMNTHEAIASGEDGAGQRSVDAQCHGARSVSKSTRAKGGGTLGMAKHRKSGKPGKGPKLRQHLKMEAEKDKPKRGRVKTEMKGSVRELLN